MDLIATINENDKIDVENESTDSDEESVAVKKRKKKKGTNIVLSGTNDMFSNNFDFMDGDDDFEKWGEDFATAHDKAVLLSSSLDDKIAKRRRLALNKNKSLELDCLEELETANVSAKADNHDEKREDLDYVSNEDYSSSDDETKKDTIRVKITSMSKKRKKYLKTAEETESEHIKYAEEITSANDISFQDMNLSRPLMKALSAMNFSMPTPIQAATIPVALLNKDVCACAATGTGKTAAFMLPVLERLLYKPREAPVTRVLVLAPTRELAVQIHQVSRQLARYTNVEISLSAGGLDVKAQEAALRMGPDVVIATPGRLIDHLHNAPSFNLGSIEILILDEADRMLDEYFAEQMKEVIRLCSRTRQTMLFSATMTEEVKDLAAVSLKDPVKIFMNENRDVAMNLRQEFIRIRENREGDREAMLAALLKRNFTTNTIVFIQTKVQAHRMHILLGLLGLKVGELHGNLSQQQRLEALKRFKDGDIDILLATDLAARGLDIQGIKTVMNFTMPNSLQHYIHRVGRTARAGKLGRAISLLGEKERKLLKEIVKRAQYPVKSRAIPPEVVTRYRDKIHSLEDDIKLIQQQEEAEKQLRSTEAQFNKATKLLDNANYMGVDRKRTWFQSHKERQQEKKSLSLEEFKLNKSKSRNKQKIKLTPVDRIEREIQKSALYSARAAKKSCRERKTTVFDEGRSKSKKKKIKRSPVASFQEELTSTGKRALKKFRAGPSYEERKKMAVPQKRKGSSRPQKFFGKKSKGKARNK